MVLLVSSEASSFKVLDYRKDYPPPPSEISKWTIFSIDPPNYEYQSVNEMVPDEDLGFVHTPNSIIRHIKRTDKKVVYDAVYRFDQYSRRVVPMDNRKSRTKFLIYYGCSFTYGNGLDDDQTFPYYVSKLEDQYSPYNYSIGATGPNTMLALLEKGKLIEQIPEKTGKMIYVYIDSHIDRSNGHLPTLGWLKNAPYYIKNDSGELVRNGSFTTGRKWLTKLYQLQGKLLDFMGLEDQIFPTISKPEIQYTCELIAQSKKVFQKFYPAQEFHVLFHPLGSGEELSSKLSTCLKNKNVAVIEFVDFHGENLQIPLDDHPTALANQKIAKALVQALKL